MAEQPKAVLDDDMHDPRDRDAAFPLGDYLRACDPPGETVPCLRRDFEEADSHAGTGQRWHQIFTRAALILGLGALLAGLAQHLFAPHYPFLEPGGLVFRIELVYTVGVLACVLFAIWSRKREKWLMERYKAEHLRLLKFRLLIDPKLWQKATSDLTPWQNELETQRRRISHLPEDVLTALKHTDALPDLPRTDDCGKVQASAIRPLLDYYRRKRINSQLDYFERKTKLESSGENPLLQPLMFFLGIALSLANLLLEWASGEAPRTERMIQTSLWLVFLSLAVPLGWNALRTARGARELSRNRSRAHARVSSLSDLKRSLDTATAGPPEAWDLVMIFGYLYLCEGILAADQYEWIRLMADAEWYG
jgi:hypothetical protein